VCDTWCLQLPTKWRPLCGFDRTTANSDLRVERFALRMWRSQRQQDSALPRQQRQHPPPLTTPAQNGAVIASLSSTTRRCNHLLHTWTESAPAVTSQQYQAPFLVARTLTVKAMPPHRGLTAPSPPRTFLYRTSRRDAGVERRFAQTQAAQPRSPILIPDPTTQATAGSQPRAGELLRMRDRQHRLQHGEAQAFRGD